MLNKAQKWVFQALLLIRSWLPFALCFTEQKNNDVVRRHVGYLRLQTEQEVELLKRALRSAAAAGQLLLPLPEARLQDPPGRAGAAAVR